MSPGPTPDPTPEELFIEWEATAAVEELRLTFHGSADGTVVLPYPPQRGETLLDRAGSESLRVEIVFPASTETPVAVRFRLERDARPAMEKTLWLSHQNQGRLSFTLD